MRAAILNRARLTIVPHGFLKYQMHAVLYQKRHKHRHSHIQNKASLQTKSGCGRKRQLPRVACGIEQAHRGQAFEITECSAAPLDHQMAYAFGRRNQRNQANLVLKQCRADGAA